MSEWKWWGGYDEERCVYGPHDTRQGVIDEAISDRLGEFQAEDGSWMIGVHVCEARNDPLRLADWIGNADELLNRAEESVCESDRCDSEDDEGPFFACSPEREADLNARIKRACDEWQAAHGLVFTCRTFSHTRNHEHVVVPLPDNEDQS